MPDLLSTGLNLLSGATKQLGWTAQTFLPGQPNASWLNAGANAQNVTNLTRILEQGAHSTTPSGPGAPWNNQGGVVDPGNIGGIIADAVTGVPTNQAAQAATAGNSRDNGWFDLQRVGFLVLGIGLIIIGVTFIVKNAGDVSLDNNLKKSQLKLNQRALAAGDKVAETLKAEPKPEAVADHASDPRPDFGKRHNPNTIEAPPRRKGTPGFARGAIHFMEGGKKGGKKK